MHHGPRFVATAAVALIVVLLAAACGQSRPVAQPPSEPHQTEAPSETAASPRSTQTTSPPAASAAPPRLPAPVEEPSMVAEARPRPPARIRRLSAEDGAPEGATPEGGVQAAAATASPPPFASQPVETLVPEIRLDVPAGVDGALPADAVAAALGTPGVTFATGVSVGAVPFTLADGRRADVTLAAVDPAGIRVLVPQITADEPRVWQRLVEGELALTHEQADALGVGLEDLLEAPGGSLRLSAIAALGQPPVAHGMVDLAVAGRLGLGPPRSLLVAVAPDAWPDEVADALEAALGLDATLIYGKPQRRLVEVPRGTVWDRLALCESSGNWAANTGNGYYGGLQFLPSSWHLVGGTGMPHEASRDEQIHRAELLLARQGWRAWPVCSVRLGLRQPGPGEGPDGRPLRPVPQPSPTPSPTPTG